MVAIKLTQAVNSRQPDEVINVDSGSAKSLVDKGKATYVDQPPADEPEQPAGRKPKRGQVVTRQLVDADPAPGDAKPEDEDAEQSSADAAGSSPAE